MRVSEGIELMTFRTTVGIRCSFRTPVGIRCSFRTPVGIQCSFRTPVGILCSFRTPVGIRCSFRTPVGIRCSFRTPVGVRWVSGVHVKMIISAFLLHSPSLQKSCTLHRVLSKSLILAHTGRVSRESCT